MQKLVLNIYSALKKQFGRIDRQWNGALALAFESVLFDAIAKISAFKSTNIIEKATNLNAHCEQPLSALIKTAQRCLIFLF